jgi:hypothetical protein
MPFFNIDDLSPPAFDAGMSMHRGGLSFNAFSGLVDLSDALSPVNDAIPSGTSSASSSDGRSGFKASNPWGNGVGLGATPLLAGGEIHGIMSLRSDEGDDEGMDLDTDVVSDIGAAASASPPRPVSQGGRAGKTLRRVQQRLNGAQGAGIGRHNPLDKTLRKKHRSVNALSSMIGSTQSSSSNKGELANRLRNAASAPQLSLSKGLGEGRTDASLVSLDTHATDANDTRGSDESNVPAAPASSPNPSAFSALFSRRSSTRSQKGDEPLIPLEPVHTQGQDYNAKEGAAGYTNVPVPMSAPAGIPARTTTAATAGATGVRAQAGSAPKNQKGERQKKQQPPSAITLSWPTSGTQQGTPLSHAVPGLSAGAVAGGKNVSPSSSSLSTPQTPNWQGMMSLPSEALYTSHFQPIANLPGASQSGEHIDVSTINDPALAALASAANARQTQSLGRAAGRASAPRRTTVSAVEGAAMRGASMHAQNAGQMQAQSAGPTFPTFGYVSQSAPVSTISMPHAASNAAQRAADASPTYYHSAMIQAQRDAQLQMQIQLQAQLQQNMPAFETGLGLQQPVKSSGIWQGTPAAPQPTVTLASTPGRNIAGSKRVGSSPAGRKNSLPGMEPPFVTAGNRRGQWEFVNYGIEDADELCAAVAPSGSYKVPLSGFVPDGEDEDEYDEESTPSRKKKSQGKRASGGSSASKGSKTLSHKRSRSDVQKPLEG